MTYLAEILTCQRIKSPVAMYVDTIAHGEYEYLGRELTESIARSLQKEHRAYLATSVGFSGTKITYANEAPDKALKAHEEWHQHLEAQSLTSPAGDFIEEATAEVVEAVIGGYGNRYSGLSSSFIQTQLLVQKSSGNELEKILDAFPKNIIWQWDEKVMPSSCSWLGYIEDAKYLLLYDLCFDICALRGLRAAKKIYKTALKKTKREGIEAGLEHLKEHASEKIAKMYNFRLDIGGYFPSYEQIRHSVFFDGKLEVEVYGADKTWLEPVEREMRKRGLKS